jgi:hypothetical protein
VLNNENFDSLKFRETAFGIDNSHYFLDWLAAFPYTILVMLNVFADESGFHDNGYGASVLVVSGYIASAEYWSKFSIEWEKTLIGYDVHCPFHFSQFTDTKRSDSRLTNPDNPYFGWDDERLDNYLYDLAKLASEEAIPLGGHCHKKKFREQGGAGSPAEIVFDAFFSNVQRALDDRFPNFKDTVGFVFHWNSDRTWRDAAFRSHDKFKKDSRFGGLTFENEEKFTPLQAADLIAGPFRQLADKFYNENYPFITLQNHRIIDLALQRHHWPILSGVPQADFNRLIDFLRQDNKRQKSEWKAKGIKQEYRPLLHFPFENHRVFAIGTGGESAEKKLLHLLLLAVQLRQKD